MRRIEFLPNSGHFDGITACDTKLRTYGFLHKLGLPVLKSVIICNPMEASLEEREIKIIRSYLSADKALVRRLFCYSNRDRYKSGHLVCLDKEHLMEEWIPNAYLWLFEPADCIRNSYAFNAYFNFSESSITLCFVGRGFDSSDLTKGRCLPHETVVLDLPIRRGHQNEWWKFAHFSFMPKDNYYDSKEQRTKFLLEQYSYQEIQQWIDEAYNPITIDDFERLLGYLDIVCDCRVCDDFVISGSQTEKGLVFWDIQTYAGKMREYGL